MQNGYQKFINNAVTNLCDENGEPVVIADKVQQKLYFKSNIPFHARDILRKNYNFNKKVIKIMAFFVL